MRISAHCLIKNEENFIWYAINSVINEVDEVFIGLDSGSTDNTEKIVRDIKNKKIKIKKYDIESGDDVTLARQDMLNSTNADWIFILDGDEIWWKGSIENWKLEIENTQCDVVVVHYYMLLGDMFHYQEEVAGKYKIGNKVGHLTVRAVKNTPGLHLNGIYPNEAYVSKEGIAVQNLPQGKILSLNRPYLHASFLLRSSKSRSKYKFELGEEFPKDYYYPEVFFKKRPDFVPFVFEPMSFRFKINAMWQTPLKKIKRRLL